MKKTRQVRSRRVRAARGCPSSVGPATSPRASARAGAADPAAAGGAGVPHAVCTTDPGGRFTYVSDGFADLTGYAQHEIIGHPARLLRSDRTDPRLFEAMWQRITAGHPWQGTIVNRRRNGSLYVAELTIIPVFDAGGTIVSFAAVQRLLANGPEAHVLPSATGAPLSDQWLATLFHEVRQPLHVMLGYAELLADHPAAEVRTFARRILATGNHITRLSDDMLDLLRAGTGCLRVRDEPFDARRVVREVVDAFRPLARVRQLRLEYAAPRHAILLVSDPTRVRQILSNLVDNALKYTVRGRVTVRVEETRTDVALSVRDTGIGIPAGDVERAFAAFARLGPASTGHVTGWGIGLALVRQLALILGGQITVASSPGRGSRFTVRLPKSSGHRLPAPDAAACGPARPCT